MKKIVFLVILFSKISLGYINIYPTKFNKDITNGATQVFKLYNRTDEERKYRIYIEGGEKNTMSQWIEVYPQSISLKPLEEDEIRIAITPPSTIPKGEYRAKLVIKEVEVPKQKKEKKVRLMTIFKLNMKGYVGEKDVI